MSSSGRSGCLIEETRVILSEADQLEPEREEERRGGWHLIMASICDNMGFSLSLPVYDYLNYLI